MLITIDIGNTNTKIAAWEGATMVAHWRLETHRQRLTDEYAVLVRSLFELRGISIEQIEGCAISCVVPPLTGVFSELSRTYLNVEPVVIGPGIKTGMRLLIDTPRELGADRVANSVAAFRRFGGPVIAIAFGTAIAFDVISADGDYVGGAIAPGLGIAADALFRTAAKLYQVELVRPAKVIGKNTSSYMQSGIVLGYAGLVEGLINRMWHEIGVHGTVVATGGQAEVIADIIARETRVIDHVDPWLTHEGLHMIYQLNRGSSAEAIGDRR
ncbi:MAG: type III pantothenate kinase [Herpetosiphon sp.]|nr:type III pantothenate kinase [Herpetosiphon sp.]